MDTINEILKEQKTFFKSGKTRPVEFRIAQLRKMQRWIHEHEQQIYQALREDLNKAPFETYATEMGIVLEEINFACRHLKRWAKPRRVPTPITQFPSHCFRYPEPYGTVLIMSPWNYPFMLTLAPLVGALAAGNCAVLKPSAYSPATSAVIAKMTEELYPCQYVAAVQGGREENQELLKQRFDYIFFTGGVSVGKLVMKSASEHLTPVTLELGGKSPCIVDETANIKLAARRIVWGKYLNAGQTCVAPDYLLVHSSVRDALLEEMKKQIRAMFGEHPEQNPEYPKIINEKHFLRLQGLMKDGNLVTGGQINQDTRQIAPTIIDGITEDSPIMQEEIFGPIMPVLTFENLEEAIAFAGRREKPLALYLFTGSKKRQDQVLSRLSFGGGCINDTVVHLATSYMPFGGVGSSGMGQYHGKESFETFSHQKSIMKKSLLLDIPLRYPPYRDLYLKLLKMIQK